jgi:hypothetical protein
MNWGLKRLPRECVMRAFASRRTSHQSWCALYARIGPQPTPSATAESDPRAQRTWRLSRTGLSEYWVVTDASDGRG